MEESAVLLIQVMISSMSRGSPVTTEWGILTLLIEETASTYGG
jgi:hypothetical protein